VRDLPLAGELAKAESRAKPEVDFFALSSRRPHPVETVAESDVVARCDIEVAIFVVDRALEGGKPFLKAFFIERVIFRVLAARG